MQKSKKIEKQEQELSLIMREQFRAFELSYNMRGGYKTYTAPAYFFIDFFWLCDKTWQKISDYNTLCSQFSPAQLERFMPVLKWLVISEQISVDEQTATIFILKGGVHELLANYGENIPVVLQSYLDYLVQRMTVKNLKPTTIRNTIQTAIYLYLEMGLTGAKTPSQEQIDTYLKRKAGVTPQLSNFCKFLNENFDTQLICKCPPKKKPVITDNGYGYVTEADRKIYEKAFIELATLPKPLNDKQRLAWIDYGLKYFHRHDIHLKKLTDVDILNCDENPELMTVKHHENSFPIPRFD